MCLPCCGSADGNSLVCQLEIMNFVLWCQGTPQRFRWWSIFSFRKATWEAVQDSGRQAPLRPARRQLPTKILQSVSEAESLPQARLGAVLAFQLCVKAGPVVGACLGMLSTRALGTTRDADVKPGDRICEADIYRDWSGKEDRALGEESFVEVRARRGCTWNEGAAHGVR